MTPERTFLVLERTHVFECFLIENRLSGIAG